MAEKKTAGDVAQGLRPAAAGALLPQRKRCAAGLRQSGGAGVCGDVSYEAGQQRLGGAWGSYLDRGNYRPGKGI